jgi:uncharacterized protein YoaH (UPF0181 family)
MTEQDNLTELYKQLEFLIGSCLHKYGVSFTRSERDLCDGFLERQEYGDALDVLDAILADNNLALDQDSRSKIAKAHELMRLERIRLNERGISSGEAFRRVAREEMIRRGNELEKLINSSYEKYKILFNDFQKDSCEQYIKQGEYGLALEELVAILIGYDVKVEKWVYDNLKKAGEMMHLEMDHRLFSTSSASTTTAT